MKRLIKLTAVLLCLTLTLTLSISASADDVSKAQDISNIEDPIIVDENVNIDVNDDLIINDLTERENSTRSATTGIVSGAVYRIKNVGSGKYMNVHNGVDADGTNIYQWTGDGSTEQKFRVVYFADSDAYLIYAMCSSSGRVLDIYDPGGVLAHGENVKLHTASEPSSQQVNIVALGQNQFRISMKSNNSLYLAAYGNSNGTSGGTTATSAGNIYLSNYVGEMYQHWMFELVENPPNPTGNLEEVSASRIKGWAYQTGMPDTPIDVHIYIKNNSTGAQKTFILSAKEYRADLQAAGYGNGAHAFNYTMDWSTYPSGTYTVSVYGINANGGTNPHLPNSPKTFTVRKATGTVEEIGDSFISGSAWKPDAPNNRIQVHLYIRHLDGTNAITPISVIAGVIDNSGNVTHDFSIPVNWSTLPEERLRVTLYAVDGSGENPIFYDMYYENGTVTTPIPTTSYVWPTESKRISQIYDPSSGHYGLDIGAVTAGIAGDPIYCFADGYVSRSGYSTSYGYVVYINHINPDQSISTYIQTRYAHMMSASSAIAGTNITKGTTIGYMGNSGTSSGVHLHFETRITTVYQSLNSSEDKSYCINPLTYFDSSNNVLMRNTNDDSITNPWGLIFDINDIEIDRYEEVEDPTSQ